MCETSSNGSSKNSCCILAHSHYLHCFSNQKKSSVSSVTEWGDDVRPISEEEAMVIVNHQSTGDVCTLMMCLQDKGTVREKTCCLTVSFGKPKNLTAERLNRVM